MEQMTELLLNFANPTLMSVLGFGYGLLSFITVILIEARIMKKYFEFSLENRILYAFILNLITAIGGLYFVASVTTDTQGFLIMLLLTLALTILIEGFCLLIFLFKKYPPKAIISYTIQANLISYSIAILAPYLIWAFLL